MLRKFSNSDESNANDNEELKKNLKATSFTQMIDEISAYFRQFMLEGWYREVMRVGLPIILVGRKCKNFYVNLFRERVENFFHFQPSDDYRGRRHTKLHEENWWTCFDDNSYGNFSKLKNIISLLNQKEKYTNQRNFIIGYLSTTTTSTIDAHSEYVKLYIIFWNLFLCALDDDIYNEQLPLVIELAHCFHLDEHIMCDLCRGVEYVLSGKKLSPECDLQCDTVECAKFFLGKEE